MVRSIVMEYSALVLMAIFNLFNLNAAILAVPGTIQEICRRETFDAECPQDHVIIMIRALYGRMRLGRCVLSGKIGCVADVIVLFDKECSGKRQCSVYGGDRRLDEYESCPQTDVSYLEVAFHCIEVTQITSHTKQCRSSGVAKISGQKDGVLSSSQIYTNTQGSRLCRWVIEGQPGQLVNITMVNFNRTTSTSYQTPCVNYFIISETSTKKQTNICPGDEREKNIYTSSSESVELQFSRTAGSGGQPNYLLKFSLIGCADPEIGRHEILNRTVDVINLYCASTGDTTTLHCVDREWDGVLGECKESVWDAFKGWRKHKVMILVLCGGIVLGIVLGVALMGCLYMCWRVFRRHDLPDLPVPNDPHYSTKEMLAAEGVKGPDGSPRDYGGYNTYERRQVPEAGPYYHALGTSSPEGSTLDRKGMRPPAVTKNPRDTSPYNTAQFAFIDDDDTSSNYQRPI